MNPMYAFGARSLAILAVTLTLAGCGETPPAPPPEPVSVEEKAQTAVLEKSTWIRDGANVIEKRDQERLARKLKAFRDSTPEKPQIVVITVNSLGGRTIEEFANDEFKRIKIGNAKHDNGILILIAKEERKLRIEVGYGFEGAIPDMVANQIIREQMIPNLKRGSENWYKAIDNAVDALIVKAKI